MEVKSLMQSRIKGQGAPKKFSLEGPYDVIHDVIACKIYVFADSQRSRLLSPVVDYVPARAVESEVPSSDSNSDLQLYYLLKVIILFR